jgi:beta-mannosidase
MKKYFTVPFSPCLRGSVAFFLLALSLPAQEITQSLNSNWQFTESGKNEWMKANVPGTVHTDLMANGKIPDPYIGTNESQVQWVETKTWEYKTTFNASEEIWKSKHKKLVFEGLDTYAFVYLNDSLILTGENMFIEYGTDVARYLKKTNNILRIVFHPASELIEKNKKSSTVKNLPGGDRVFIRKAQYQFGWDWGPRLVTAGIWKNVRLEGSSDEFKAYTKISTVEIQNGTATLSFVVITTAAEKSPAKIRISDEQRVYFSEKDTPVYDKRFNTNIVSVQIPHARLWWCNGMGKQEMYNFTITVTDGKNKSVETVRYAIRTTRLDTGANGNGNAFTLFLNNEPVFIKGANWIPCDNFLPRVTSEKYYSLLKSAQQSNMNMLRVWGGGAYEHDHFYNICDSLGIMVWQDFMFAGGMIPDSKDFLQLTIVELDQNIHRLAAHPCIAIWCGNNEITEGWNNWGWQKEYKISPEDSVAMIKRYLLLFETEARLSVSLNGAEIPYIPSSPATGWGHPEAYRSGDVHYWGVWWGMEPFSAYDTHVGRFVSEYGFQGIPTLSSYSLFDADGTNSFADPVFQAHQKHPKGFETINTYMQRDYPVPDEFADYVYVSQVVQRDGVSRAIEAHRKAMPYCMGTLFWQYNDCWPVTSWSSVDYYGQKKLLQYALKDLYAPLLVSVTERNDSVLIYLINDDTISHKGLLAFACMNMNGNIGRTSFTPTTINAGRSNMVIGFEKKQLFDTLKPESAVLHVVFNYENNKSIGENHFFVPAKSLKLTKDPGLVNDIVPVAGKPGTYTITLRTVSLAKNVYLSLNDPKATFSDNGFDMLAGDTKDVTITTSLSLAELKAALKIQTMNTLVGQ